MTRSLAVLILSLFAIPAIAAGPHPAAHSAPMRADHLLFGPPGGTPPARGHDLSVWILEPASKQAPPAGPGGAVGLLEDILQSAGSLEPGSPSLLPGAHAPQALPD
jgi:hypothetical protein